MYNDADDDADDDENDDDDDDAEWTKWNNAEWNEK